VGIATIQGLAFTTQRRVAAVSALEALADAGAQTLRSQLVHDAACPLVAAWTNARRGEVFAALYRPRLTASGSIEVVPIDDAFVATPTRAAERLARHSPRDPLLVVGDLEEELVAPFRERAAGGWAGVSRPLLAAALVRLGLRAAERGSTVAPHAVKPLYVRPPDAVLARERAARIAEGSGPR
jgi:tRNA A37 threonylcarbamoyladenosine modification protein TsaB